MKNVVANDGTTLRVGVFGVIDDSFYHSTASENVKGICFSEESAAATALAKTLREKEGCQIVLALTHNADCIAFIRNTKGIDAVIAGHEHIVMDKTCKDADGKAVRLVEAGSHFNQVGVLTLTYDTEKNAVTDFAEKTYMNQDLTELSADADVAFKTAEIEKRQAAVLSTVVGHSEEAYPYSWEAVRCGEQAIGRMVTAAYIDRTGADIAFENAGGIRGGIPCGDITHKDIISISPYGNTLLTKQLRGSQILALLEYSIELSRQCDAVYALQKAAVENGEDPYQYAFPEDSGSVLQFGGMTVEYDLGKPAGERVVSVKIGKDALDSERVYTAAMNNYVAENADYKGLAESPIVKEYGTCAEALQAYIGKGAFETAAKTPCLVLVQASEQGGQEPSEKPEVPPVQVPIPETGGTPPLAEVCFFAAASVTAFICTNKKKRS